MKEEKTEFNHINGELAYQIFWDKGFRRKRSLESIKSVYLNLELMMFNKKWIAAYRYDTPDDLKWMKLSDGEWKIYDKYSFNH
jgi:hypothetical protein